jgi:hypothetical protein
MHCFVQDLKLLIKQKKGRHDNRWPTLSISSKIKTGLDDFTFLSFE